MQKLTAFIIACLVGLVLLAQPSQIKKMPGGDKNIAASASLLVPVGDFSKTHFGGIGLEAGPASHVFDLIKRKKIAFTYEGGIAYYFGKNEKVIGFEYDYPGYLFIHAFAGLLCMPITKTEIKLIAGPALGIYNGDTRFNIGSKLEGNYYINANFSIGPGIIMMKEFDTDALWAAALKVTFIF